MQACLPVREVSGIEVYGEGQGILHIFHPDIGHPTSDIGQLTSDLGHPPSDIFKPNSLIIVIV